MDVNQCKGYSDTDTANYELQAAKADMRVITTILPGAREVWDVYLTPGVATPDRMTIDHPDVLKQFRSAAPTQTAVDGVMKLMLQHVGAQRPVLQSNSTAITPPAGLGEHLKIYYGFGSVPTYPAFLAGGTGGNESPAGSFADDRQIVGQYGLEATTTETGVLQTVSLKATSLRLRVLDSIDFCPGALGPKLVRSLTVPLSRLERTSHPIAGDAYVGGATYTKPVLYIIEAPLDNEERDVTGSYPTNDPDLDGYADWQPWKGAGYILDNCPNVSNPKQSDHDGDGHGDACDPTVLEWRLEIKQRTRVNYGNGVTTHRGESRYTLAGDMPLATAATGKMGFEEAYASSSWVNASAESGVCGQIPPLEQIRLCDTSWKIQGTTPGAIRLGKVKQDDAGIPIEIQGTFTSFPRTTVFGTCTGSCDKRDFGRQDSDDIENYLAILFRGKTDPFVIDGFSRTGQPNHFVAVDTYEDAISDDSYTSLKMSWIMR